MTVQEWAIVIGVAMSALLAAAPWGLMVHAKLAVLTTEIKRVEEKVDKLIEDNKERVPMCATHAARLDWIDAQMAQVYERLRESK